LITAYTIGTRNLKSHEETAARIADYPLLKVKVGEDDPLDIVDAVRRGSPNAKLIIDFDQSWSVERLMKLAPVLADHNIVLLEQPIAVGDEHRHSGWRSPIPLCADELVSTSDDLDAIGDEFPFVNVKLDKSGGLTGALRIVDKVKERGLRPMVGCMAGSSLAMAPALLIAAHAEFIDLDGPLLQAEDVEPGLLYQSGMIQRPPRGLRA
jgi:L-alanine-DL-glutamate epimerase-like enolase superfamily enzyme